MSKQGEFPVPLSQPGCIARDKVLCDLKAGPADSRLLLVDVRRDDHRGGTIKGSLNLPAQTLYYSLETLHAIATRANLDAVVFYCGDSFYTLGYAEQEADVKQGSCGGRGPRCAGWFADTIKTHADEQFKLKSLFLEGGIKGWVRSGDEYIEAMEGFDAGAWES